MSELALSGQKSIMHLPRTRGNSGSELRALEVLLKLELRDMQSQLHKRLSPEHCVKISSLFQLFRAFETWF